MNNSKLFDEITANKVITECSQSNLSVYEIIRYNGTSYFLKSPRLPDATIHLSRQEKKWVKYVTNTFFPFQWRMKPKCISNIILAEAQTLENWHRYHIRATQLVGFDNQQICTKFLNGINYKEKLEENINESELTGLCETFNSIRHIALKKDSPNILHADPKLKNFMCADKLVYAIDPANILNRKYTTRELDLRLTTYFLYGAFSLDISREKQRKLATYMASSLDRKTISALQPENATMLTQRRNWPARIDSFTFNFPNYSVANICFVQNILESKQ